MSTILDISSWISRMKIFTKCSILQSWHWNGSFFYFLVECCYKGWKASTISYCLLCFHYCAFQFIHFCIFLLQDKNCFCFQSLQNFFIFLLHEKKLCISSWKTFFFQLSSFHKNLKCKFFLSHLHLMNAECISGKMEI